EEPVNPTQPIISPPFPQYKSRTKNSHPIISHFPNSSAMDTHLLTTLTLTAILILSSFPSQSDAQTCKKQTFSANQVYSACVDLPALTSFLHWNFHDSNNTADIAFRKAGTSPSSWVCWALNPSGGQMVGSQALIAYQLPNGSMNVYTSSIDSYGPSMAPGRLSFRVTNLRGERTSGETTIYATLHLDSKLLSTNQVWQEGPLVGGAPAMHLTSGDNVRAVGAIDFQTGAASGGGGGGGGGSNSRLRKRNIHGILNAVSWGIMMPIGAIIARYLKVFKSANPAWFYLHVACQLSAYIVGVAGWGTGLKLGSESAGIQYSKHRNIGITLFCFGTLQAFALLLRPKPDHKYRIYWNMYHHSIGYATISLSIANVYLGFGILDPAQKWKRAYTAVIIVLGAIALVLEAVTWLVVIKRKQAVTAAEKHGNGGGP
ncbi:Cytochrome b561 and DOMON domain-containing protein At5g47530, partial [Linum grandiflorum]